jgi:hypothetical protein
MFAKAFYISDEMGCSVRMEFQSWFGLAAAALIVEHHVPLTQVKEAQRAAL